MPEKDIINKENFLELLSIIDTMTNVINDVGGRNYCNFVRKINERTDRIRKAINDTNKTK